MNDSQRFILNEPCHMLEEGWDVEFKEVKGDNPANSVKSNVDTYVTAFLNHLEGRGGSIYWGIRDKDRIITGVVMDAAKRDEVRQLIDNKLRTVVPSVEGCYAATFHPVYTADNEQPVEDRWVLQVQVSRPHKENPSIYFASGKHCHVKTSSGTKEYTGPELVRYIHNREKTILDYKPVNELSEFTGIFNEIAPLLRWSVEPPPKDEATPYFLALQVLFNSQNRLLEDLDEKLLDGMDYLLRAMCALSVRPLLSENDVGYASGRMDNAWKYFHAFLNRHAPDNTGVPTYRIHSIQADAMELSYRFSRLLESTGSVDHEHAVLVRLLIALLGYIQLQARDNNPEVPSSLTTAVADFCIRRAKIKLGLYLHTGARDELAEACEPNWKAWKAEQMNDNEGFSLWDRITIFLHRIS